MSGTRSIAARPQAGTADRGRQPSLSLALLVIATAQLMVVLDGTVRVLSRTSEQVRQYADMRAPSGGRDLVTGGCSLSTVQNGGEPHGASYPRTGSLSVNTRDHTATRSLWPGCSNR